MAVNYTIPSWLAPRGDSPADAYIKGFQLGEQRREANARIAAEMAQAQMQAAARAQEQAARERMAKEQLASEIQRQQEAARLDQEKLDLQRAIQKASDREAALRYAAGEAIQRDIAAGVAPETSVMRNIGMFASDPGAMASTLRSVLPPPNPTVREFPGTSIPAAVQIGNRLEWPPGIGQRPAADLFSVKEVRGPGGDVIGYGVVTGPESGTFREIRPQTLGAVDRAMLGATISRLKANESELARQKATLPMVEKYPKTKAMIQERIAQLEESIRGDMGQIESMRKSDAAMAAPANPEQNITPPAPQSPPAQPSPRLEGVLLRRKSDGKLMLYKGDRKDIPDNVFEILN